MISFRMSDEEYRILKALCASNGSRSVSELARVAIQKLLVDRDEPGDRALAVRMDEFQGRLMLLDHEVARLSRLLQQTSSGD